MPLDVIQAATWQGLPISVTNYRITLRPDLAVHSYPYKSYPWLEAMGPGLQQIEIEGYVLANALQSAGVGIGSQLGNLWQSALGGTGTLQYPRGTVTAGLTDASFSETTESLGKIAITFRFTICADGDPDDDPGSVEDTQATVDDAADDLPDATDSVGTDLTTALASGASVAKSVVSTVQGYAALAQGVVSSASRTIASVKGIGALLGGNLTAGRYDMAGLTTIPSALSGINNALSIPAKAAAGVTALIAGATASRAAVSSAVDGLTQAAEDL